MEECLTLRIPMKELIDFATKQIASQNLEITKDDIVKVMMDTSFYRCRTRADIYSIISNKVIWKHIFKETIAKLNEMEYLRNEIWFIIKRLGITMVQYGERYKNDPNYIEIANHMSDSLNWKLMELYFRSRTREQIIKLLEEDVLREIEEKTIIIKNGEETLLRYDKIQEIVDNLIGENKYVDMKNYLHKPEN